MLGDNYRAFMDRCVRVVKSSERSRSRRAILLTTHDRNHTISLLKKVAALCNWLLYIFTIARRTRYNPAKMAWETVGGEISDCA